MRFQISAVGGLFALLLVSLLFTSVTAQDEQPAPQFLYRTENRLILLNGYTGEETKLPINIAKEDRFTWSPDRQYLLARIDEGKGYRTCLNLYDVDRRVWVSDEPISCSVGDATFSSDATRVVYSMNDENNGALWLYTLADAKREELYRTENGDELGLRGISDPQWSPTETYLTFISYREITGGDLKDFIVMNMDTRNHFTLQVRDSYYAYYNPVWSEDDRWFLITLKDEYVTSGGLPRTNHQGDVYLVNAETGEQHRLTYTPASYEMDIRWTDEGNIAFTEVSQQEFTFTFEEAMDVEAVPDEAIVTPEPMDMEDFYNPLDNVMFSPDPNLGAWVDSILSEQDEYIYELKIGKIVSFDRTVSFSISVEEDYRYNGTLIGWRPSDYPYSRD